MAIRVTRQALEVLHSTRLPLRVTRQAIEVLWSETEETLEIPVIGHPLSEVFGYYRVREFGKLHATQRDTVRFEGQVSVVDGPEPNTLHVVPGATQRLSWALTGNVDDGDGGDATAFDAANVIVLSGTGPFNITGLIPSTSARRKLLVWTGSGELTLVNASGSSTAENRWSLPSDIILQSGFAAWIFYEPVIERWYARKLSRPEPYPITTRSEMHFWLRADLELSPGTIASWPDQFDHAIYTISPGQVTADARPTAVASGGLNGLAYVRFTRDSDISGDLLLDAAAGQSAPANARPHMFVVARWHAVPTEQETLLSMQVGTSRYFQLWSSGIPGINLRGDTDTGNASIFGPTTDTNWHLFEAWYDGSSIYMRIDGGTTDSAALTGDLEFDDTTFAVILGGGSTASEIFCGNIDVAEVIARTSNASLSERQAMYAYLNERYGQSWALPS